MIDSTSPSSIATPEVATGDYRDIQGKILQNMCGKVRALSKLLRDNFGLVMQGVGAVVPAAGCIIELSFLEGR